MATRYALRCLPVMLVFGAIPFRGLAQGDTCSTALQVISGVYASTGPTSGYAGPSCGGGTNGNWYLYTPNFTGAITIGSCHPLNIGLSFDTYLKVYTGNCSALTCIGFNDDVGGAGQGCPNNAFASYMQVNVIAGQNYYIVWTNTFSSLPFTWELNECEGTAAGATYYDNNDNGTREVGEAHAPVMLLVQPGDHHVYAGNDPYSFCTDLGPHVVTVPTPPLYHNTVPTSRNFDITGLGVQVIGVDFGFQGIPGMYDGSLSLWGWNPWIGNNTTVSITASNIGTETITPTVVLTVDPLLSYVSASVAPTTVNGQVVSWNLASMVPGASTTIIVTVHTGSTVLPGTTIIHYVQLNTAETDVNTANNQDDLHSFATSSFDPNEKLVDTNSITPQEVIDQRPIEYTVHFQNEGTAPAVNIVVKDSIDADWDLSTFEMVGASHPYTLTVNDQVAIWTFANVMLPTSDSDELGSQGGFHYRVAPKPSVPLGGQLTNRADIYFDYNPAVLTNTTVTTVELNTGIEAVGLGNGLAVVPSPSNGMVNIRWNDVQLNNAHFSVMDALGRTVHTTNLSGVTGRSMDLSFLPEGSYVARLTGANGEVWTRFVIQR